MRFCLSVVMCSRPTKILLLSGTSFGATCLTVIQVPEQAGAPSWSRRPKRKPGNFSELTFAVLKDGVRFIWSGMGMAAVAQGLCLLLSFLLFELLVNLLLPGLWSQVRAALPLAVGQRLHRVFWFGPIQACLLLF